MGWTMKIVADAQMPFVKEAFGDFGVVFTLPGREITREVVRGAEILLVRSVTPVGPELLEGSSVRFVGTATIGMDHVDVAWLTENGIGFARAPGCNAESVAEYVVAALLELAGRRELVLQDLTIGVVGVGNVGSRVIRHAEALGLKYLANDPPKQRAMGGGYFRPLEEVLAGADIVSLHVPLTTEGEDATFHLVDHEFLSRMKPGGVLINTSRGKVVDEKSLRADAGKLGGIVLDVWDNEPSISQETLRIADIATPHIAGYSYDGKVRGTGAVHGAACAFFFREPKWSAAGIIAGIRGRRAKVVSGSGDVVRGAVHRAYPITEDDAALRKIVEVGDQEQGDYFDRLRSGYGKRLEFSHFTVVGENVSERESALLCRLGFGVE